MLPSYRPASSAMLSRAVLSSFRQHRNRQRRSKTSCAGGNLLLTLHLQPLSLLVTVGATLCPPPIPRYSSSLPPGSFMELAASARARGPEMGDPEMEGTALREMVSAPLTPPDEGRVENLLFHFVFVLYPKHQ